MRLQVLMLLAVLFGSTPTAVPTKVVAPVSDVALEVQCPGGPRLYEVGGRDFDKLLIAGKYSDVDEEVVPASFNVASEKRAQWVETYLCRFTEDLSSERALELLKKHKLRAARTDELMTFGAIIHDPQVYDLAVTSLAARSPADVGDMVLVIGGPDASHRGLHVSPRNKKWRSRSYQFLFVREGVR